MVKVKVYVEGGGDSKEQHTRCREGFRKLFERAGFKGRMPSFVACGGRQRAYEDFCTALAGRNLQKGQQKAYPLLLVDSEDPLPQLIEKVDDPFAWAHLKTRDGWAQPERSENHQILLMATCMESWIVADREALNRHYGQALQESALPSLQHLEGRNRKDIHEKLSHATRTSKKPYRKGSRSFAILAELDPKTLQQHLSQFRRMVAVVKKILDENH